MFDFLNSGILYYIVLTAGIFVSMIFCIRRAKGFSISNLMLKISSSLCFILTGVTALISNPENYIYGGLIVFGGVMGMCGDITLDLKGLHKDFMHPYMLSGFIFFLIGHIFYQIAVFYKGKISITALLITIAVCVVFSLLNLLSTKITKYDFGKYKLIVFLYTIALALTTALSFMPAFNTHFKNKGFVIMFLGAVLFMLSDLILSGTYFGKGQDKPINYFLNHLTYYAGQYLIAASIMFI